MRERFGAAGAARNCVPAVLIGRFCAAPQLHSLARMHEAAAAGSGVGASV